MVFVTQAGIERAILVTWDPVQHIFTDPNYLDNKENMTAILQGISLISEDLENVPEAIRTKNRQPLMMLILQRPMTGDKDRIFKQPHM